MPEFRTGTDTTEWSPYPSLQKETDRSVLDRMSGEVTLLRLPCPDAA